MDGMKLLKYQKINLLLPKVLNIIIVQDIRNHDT